MGGGESPSLSPEAGIADRLGRGGPSSRSPRAERRRRRKRRRRRWGRCSRLGQEPCQENTTSQLSPPIPAAVRTGTRPPALLPPRSPRLGPIVWLGAPGRREDEGGGEKEKGGKREGGWWSRQRERGGEPCTKSLSAKSTLK